MFSEQCGQQPRDTDVGEEDVVGVAELPLRLEHAVLGLQLSQRHHLTPDEHDDDDDDDDEHDDDEDDLGLKAPQQCCYMAPTR